MRRPTEQQIDIARNWLEHNEAGDHEEEACKAVALWLEHLQQEQMLREEARRVGMPVSQLKRALKARSA
jgi:predicted outer membrane lipoprotein